MVDGWNAYFFHDLDEMVGGLFSFEIFKILKRIVNQVAVEEIHLNFVK